MRVIVLVGSSGTGKSYQAMNIAKVKNIKYIIDDGLLIKENKVLEGSSAKREKSKMAAVKRALFIEEDHRKKTIETLKKENPEGILVLGTSDKMVERITKALELGEIQEKIFIQDVASQEEILIAKKSRKKEGKHIIPVPTFEIKKEFSGYFLNPLRAFKKRGKGEVQELEEKSVVRPTFSYMGKYTISDRVIRDLIFYAANKVIGIYKVEKIDIDNTKIGLIIEMEVKVVYGNPIKPLMERLQEEIIYEIEGMTSLNIVSVNVLVKSLISIE
ncbi:MAG: Asp23/Gls24 family envelope stress response protein [Clostridiaceae bacterium]|nr:Asp23/Gls24 family envelope stress response protein [Clostridiaceae bacterium]